MWRRAPRWALARAMRRRVGSGRLVALALLAALIALRALDPPVLELIRLKTFDLYQQAKPRAALARSPVVIVDIDEASLKRLGQWPWPRTLLADLVGRLADAGAVAVGLDVVLSEPDRLSPGVVAAALPELDAGLRERLAALPSHETVLAAAMRRTRTVVGQFGQPIATEAALANEAPRTSVATLGGDPRRLLFQYAGLLRNRPELEAAAQGRGLVTIRPEPDGIIRRIPAVMVAAGEITPALSIDLLRVAGSAQTLLVRSDVRGVKSIIVAGHEIATDGNGQLWVHHARSDLRRYVSAADVLSGAAGRERIAGRLVLIGSSAPGLFDLRSTPVERVVPGVEIHAQTVESILSRTLLTRPYYAVGAEVVLATLVGLGIIVLVPMLGALPVLLLGGASSLALATGSWVLFDRYGLLFDVFYPLATSAAVFLLLAFHNYVREENKRAAVRTAFSRYLSPALVDQLAREPDRLVLGGETREMTVLFADIRGFTTLSERFRDDPAGLTDLVNQLLTPLSHAILDRRGTIDKYMGDAILAFWNAPLDDPQHAENAVAAALDMLARLAVINREREASARASGEPFLPIDIGIGLNTGTCVVGNMGSDLRFDYSVIGDSVNIASRLENLTKVYGVPVLVGSSTAAVLGDRFACVPMDRVRVKGKTEPEEIFAVVGGAGLAADPAFARLSAEVAAMRIAYARRDWPAARTAINGCRTTALGTRFRTALDLFEQRIATLEAEQPSPAWDGIATMTSKAE